MATKPQAPKDNTPLSAMDLGGLDGDDDEGTGLAAAPGFEDEAPAAPVRATQATKTAGYAGEKKYKIVLEDNAEIPPGGQFISGDGRTFKLQSGVEVEVPEVILNVLETSMTSIPVMNDERQVIGYRDRLRFPFRHVRDDIRGR